MKRKLQIIISASAASVLAFSALAQDASTPKTDAADHTSGHLPRNQRPDRLNDAAKASDLIGMTVKNYQGEKLGKVENLAVDLECGRIVQVILSTGGFIGIGDTLTAVPPCALNHDATAKVLQLDASLAKFKAAPRFDPAKWDEGTQSNRVTEVYAYYGAQPYFLGDRSGYGTTNRDGTSKWNGARNPDGTWTAARSSNENDTKSPWTKPGCIQKVSKLMGTPVKNLQDQKIGQVENFTVDLAAGRIIAVIISSGGFIGLDDELSAVPPAALRFTTDRNDLQLDTSKEMLSNAPHFKADQWPDLSQPAYAGAVYHAYNLEPYFTTNVSAGADNTARNVRDRDGRTLTPLDQSNSQADLEITAQIRKEIIAAKDLSVNAQNVKIITVNGHVTLRGPVDTAEEKRLIGEIAERIAQSGNVDNQLEVKLTASSNN
jgi:sporulation protein YlmC with PRC-barrel domain